VRLSGEIDHHSAPALRARLDALIERERPARLILDFAEVELMDSSGIGLILGRYRKLKRRGARLCVQNVSPRIDTVLQLAGLYQVIEKSAGEGR